MAGSQLSVEGPEFAQRARKVEETVQDLQDGNWDFRTQPSAFAPQAAADVVAKEIATIHDGRVLTRVGRLAMTGVGRQFNLMGPLPARSELRGTDTRILDTVAERLGSPGLRRFDGYRKFTPQAVEFFNYTMFYQLRDLVFWHLLHGSGCFPSTLEHMARHFAQGEIAQNVMYRPARPSLDFDEPTIMQAQCMTYSYPTDVVEWMDRPLFGGLAPETMHVEYLLTHEPTDISHPYLDLVDEGEVELDGQHFFVRHFAGIAQKDGLRDLDVPPEGKQAGA